MPAAGRNLYALDLAVSCGIAVGAAGACPDSYTVRLKKPNEPPAVALANLLAFLSAEWTKDLPDLVVKEAPLHLGGFAKLGNAEATVRLAYGLHAIVEALGIRFDVPVHEVGVQTVRKHFLSRSKFGDRAATKAAVVQRCHLLGYLPRDCKDNDRADACAVHDWGSAHLARTPPKALHMFGEERA